MLHDSRAEQIPKMNRDVLPIRFRLLDDENQKLVYARKHRVQVLKCRIAEEANMLKRFLILALSRSQLFVHDAESFVKMRVCIEQEDHHFGE